MADTRVIAFTGGGSGGHIFPGLAVIERLREKGFGGRIVWLGSLKDADRSAVEAAGVEYRAIPSGKLRRQLSAENLLDAFRVLAGYLASRRILAELKPRLLFSKGGYVSVPPCAAAASLGIPYFTHESDLSPGLATRLNASRAERIIVSYERTRQGLPPGLRARVSLAGNPIRRAIRKGSREAGRAWLGAEDGLPVLLFLGGSQGARQLNELVEAILPRLEGRAFVAHQAGPGALDAGGESAPSPSSGRYRRFGFISREMPDVLAAADIVVARSGAGTLWECGALAKAMILVPLTGSGTRGDQVENAELFSDAGAALSLSKGSANPERLLSEILSLLGDGPRASRMGAAAAQIAGIDAGDLVADLIMARIGAET